MIDAEEELLPGTRSYSGGFTKAAVLFRVLPSVPAFSVTVTKSEAYSPASMSPIVHVVPSKVPASSVPLHSCGRPVV